MWSGPRVDAPPRKVEEVLYTDGSFVQDIVRYAGAVTVTFDRTVWTLGGYSAEALQHKVLSS